MARSNRFDDYDDYSGYDDYSSFTKIKSHKKSKHKGHQSKRGTSEGEIWSKMIDDTDSSYTYATEMPQKPVFQPRTAPKAPETIKQSTEHVFGPNTHEIKNVKIDYDGVVAIEKVENTLPTGVRTYGIKFTFKGIKKPYRIVWFNKNVSERDVTYMKEYSFWTKLTSKQ